MNPSKGCRSPAAPAHVLPVPPFPVIDTMQHIYTLMIMNHLGKGVFKSTLEVSAVEDDDPSMPPLEEVHT
ncbi:uncharacterized protein LACBIDRAFT_296060 [Laccaria bicolor S238N-H82]|uniref:Predicted protein n=1 Tax=Laccaria bicolor (strain S238N-H82 / ATCC MYA-4686) TaxID=486041 RepID=B0E3C1_LACBS|nr:uncharacterized protein LACBIDRAFT_296060 [Laccaria bicolor S238N-H82]EDQ98656.1 predicted protein [Laccaria bicolor S238N-H82]|eukprot:XP_001890688.1 predicted protein [Laccaria bicolor S238N-H82]